MKTIAYIAPEIPTLSATFVYNEILALQERGYTLIPISLHIPSSPVQEERVASLHKQTHYLYNKGVFSLLIANLITLLTSPLRYIKTLLTTFTDAIHVGFFNRIGIGLFYRFLMASQVAILLRKNQCTHIHANFAHVPTDIAMYAAQLVNIPFSFTSHANDLFERGWLLPQKIIRSKFAATISEFNKTYLTSKGGDKDKIHIVRCGVQSKTFTPKTSTGCTPPYQIGTLGRMVEKKGFDILIKAAAILRDMDFPFEIIIAGNGPLESELKAQAEQLNLTNHIKFIGPLANQDVPKWLKTLDLFVLPCQQDSHGDMDGIPVVLMEAMVSGIPSISTKISGIPELISNEISGLLVHPQQKQELADAISRLLLDPNLYKKTSMNGGKRVRNEFDVNINIEKLDALLSAG